MLVASLSLSQSGLLATARNESGTRRRRPEGKRSSASGATGLPARQSGRPPASRFQVAALFLLEAYHVHGRRLSVTEAIGRKKLGRLLERRLEY